MICREPNYFTNGIKQRRRYDRGREAHELGLRRFKNLYALVQCRACCDLRKRSRV